MPGLKIAVIGCIVNGPGEMADANYGYVGMGNGKVALFKVRNMVFVKKMAGKFSKLVFENFPATVNDYYYSLINLVVV